MPDPFRTFIASTRNRLVLLFIVLLIIGLPFLSFIDKHSSSPTGVQNQPAAAVEVKGPAKYAVIREGFGDPCLVTNVDGKHYAFATNNATIGINVQIASAPSDNPRNWSIHRGQDALPVPGLWVLQPKLKSHVWAPSVTLRKDGKWILYYTALHHIHTARHCIGAAFSNSITGPYEALPEPFTCNFDAGGSIDPSYFHDPLTGHDFILWKIDGNAIGTGGACSNSIQPNTPTPLRIQRVNSTDLVTPIGNALYLLENNPSDGPDIEGPMMWYSDTPVPTYHLMYNSGCYHDESYHLKHIVCIAQLTNRPANTTALELCEWQLAVGTPVNSNITYQYDSSTLHADTFLKTGDLLVPGQADSNVYAPGGAGVAKNNGKLMVFHGDLDLNFFKDPGHVKRVRGMYITELKYTETTDRLELGSLQVPGG